MNTKNNHLVAGMGEIGKPLFKILSEVFETGNFDQLGSSFNPNEKYNVLHICYGYRPGEEEEFRISVTDYQKRFLKEGGITVIHSSVGIGTSRSLNAVHSPVRGQHPNLEGGLRTFTKYVSGDRAGEVAEMFRRAGLTTYVFNDQETTELGKISETTFYALMIEYVKDLKRECDERGLSFTEVYTEQARAYTEGWKKMGHPEYCMPLLVPILQPQGGHCTIPNARLWENDYTDLILKKNEKN